MQANGNFYRRLPQISVNLSNRVDMNNIISRLNIILKCLLSFENIKTIDMFRNSLQKLASKLANKYKICNVKMKQHLSSVSLYSVRQLSIYTAAGSQSVTDYRTNKSARFLFSQHISRSQIFSKSEKWPKLLLHPPPPR